MGRLIVLQPTYQVRYCHTIIRDKNVSREDFVFYSDRLIRLLIEEALNHLPMKPRTVTTLTGATYEGLDSDAELCGVPIVRAGESMEAALRTVCLGIRIGKILIQRNEETAQPKLFYSKLPEDISTRKVLLLDPMLATGGSACCAIQVLKDAGVPEENILFLNLIAVQEGIDKINELYPGVDIITTEVDEKLNETKYIIPGIGDFGDLYFGTT